MVAPLQATQTSYVLSYCSTQAQDGDATNIHGDPQFVDPAAGDLTLMDTSPCIDMGTPDATPLLLPDLDLGGNPRIVDGNNDSVARIDIGCYEWQLPPQDGAIEGVVSDSQNQPLAGALITINGVSIATNGIGYYNFSLPPGTYDVVCSHAGYTPVTEYNVVVEPGQTTTVDFVLDAVAGDDPSAPGLSTGLIGNQPNPFGRTTSIKYSLAQASPVWIGIYNLKGQLVRTLVDQELGRGYHSVAFDGLDLQGAPVSRGVYLYRIKTPGFEQTKKMVLK
jgi:hypothetical protein